jgi:hypothetical protein
MMMMMMMMSLPSASFAAGLLYSRSLPDKGTQQAGNWLLCFCGLFNDTGGSSDCTASNND